MPTPSGPARPVAAAPPGPGLPRRTVSGLVAAGALAAAAPAASAAPAPTPSADRSTAPAPAARAPRRERPHILWLVAEDHYPFVGAYGDTLARTPTLDRLAREGIRYENSYSAAPVCAPSRFALLTGMHPATAGPAQHMRARGTLPDFVNGFPQYLREAGYYTTNNDKTDYNAPVDMAATWDESSKTAHWRNRPANTPFFAVFNDMTTHESALFTAIDGPTRPQDVTLPAYLADTPEIRADFAHYYDAMATMDGHLADQLRELESAGLAEDTIVFCYSDNGGVLPRSKRYCYDEGLRTSLIVRFPAKWQHLAPRPPGSVERGAVTSVDYAPTVLALAGVDIPHHIQGKAFLGAHRPEPARYAFGGRDRMDERYDMVRTVRDDRYRYLRNYTPHRPWGQHQAFAWNARGYQSWEQAHIDGTLNAVQDRFWGTKPAEELYDLRTDPDQVRNLANDPAHAARLRRLGHALDEHLMDINDNGFIPEGSPLEGWENSRKPGAYPSASATPRSPRWSSSPTPSSATRTSGSASRRSTPSPSSPVSTPAPPTRRSRRPPPTRTSTSRTPAATSKPSWMAPTHRRAPPPRTPPGRRCPCPDHRERPPADGHARTQRVPEKLAGMYFLQCTHSDRAGSRRVRHGRAAPIRRPLRRARRR
ncbi:sulfatase [Streptomyces sp. NPDC057575]|uniref:sulfatase family protein n=1 Tax=Streptomyces sp. NPDC057575 TaxID=3346170 RepID=UPI0036863959